MFGLGSGAISTIPVNGLSSMICKVKISASSVIPMPSSHLCNAQILGLTFLIFLFPSPFTFPTLWTFAKHQGLDNLLRFVLIFIWAWAIVLGFFTNKLWAQFLSFFTIIKVYVFFMFFPGIQLRISWRLEGGHTLWAKSYKVPEPSVINFWHSRWCWSLQSSLAQGCKNWTDWGA